MLSFYMDPYQLQPSKLFCFCATSFTGQSAATNSFPYFNRIDHSREVTTLSCGEDTWRHSEISEEAVGWNFAARWNSGLKNLEHTSRISRASSKLVYKQWRRSAGWSTELNVIRLEIFPLPCTSFFFPFLFYLFSFLFLLLYLGREEERKEGKEERKEGKEGNAVQILELIFPPFTPLSKQLAWAVAASAALITRRAR